MSKRQAEAVKLRIEDLVAAKLASGTPSDETSRWLASIDDNLHCKLVTSGLAEPREERATATLGAFLDSYIEGRANLKPNTLRNYKQTRSRLIGYFGESQSLSTMTAGDAEDWQQDLLKTLSPATVSRDVRRARQFLQAALRKELIRMNPFAELAAPAQVNESREYFVTRDEAQQVLDACPDAEWRLIFALSRYGGLRTPSEHLALKWGHVDWNRHRLTVPSPKTEHHRKGASRVIPIFPELRPYLEECWTAAEAGQEYVLTRYRKNNANLRTQLNRIIARAGLKPWPKLFHNLRATRQTELVADYPLHVVCEWIGNSATIANQHYLTVTEADFEEAIRTVGKHPKPKAAQNAAQTVHERRSIALQGDRQATPESRILQGSATESDMVHKRTVPRRGVEPLSSP